MNKDTHWSQYYEQQKDFGCITSQAVTKILTFADTSLPKTLLDVGCGTGQLTREFYHRGYDCLGIDSSTTAITLAKSYTTRSGINYRCFDIEEGDIAMLPNQPYSLVTCKLVLAFIEDKKTFLQSMRLLTADQGLFVVITPTYEISTEATPIAMQRSEVLQLTKSIFSTVEVLNIGKFSYYLCS